MGVVAWLKHVWNPDEAIRKQGKIKGPGGQEMVTNGPFAIATAEGRLNCKNCGVTFDSATVLMAHGFYMNERAKETPAVIAHFAMPCRKCSVYSVFLLSDLPNPRWGMRRRQYALTKQQGVDIMFDGPLPPYISGNKIICRNCGFPFDDSAYGQARDSTHKADWHTTDIYFFKCTNCSQVCAYRMKELKGRPS